MMQRMCCTRPSSEARPLQNMSYPCPHKACQQQYRASGQNLQLHTLMWRKVLVTQA